MKRYAFKRMVSLLAVLICIINLCAGMEKAVDSQGGKYIGRIEINYKGDVLNNSQNRITTANIANLAAGLSGDAQIGYVSETSSFASRGISTFPVKTVMANYQYFYFSGLKIIKGTFFSKLSCEKGQSIAVISEGLAQKLFSSLDIIGEEFSLLDQKYRVVGIYKNKASIVSYLSSDGTERIYVPYESFNLPSGININTIIIRDSYLENEKFRKEAAEKLLVQDGRVEPAAYRITDYYNSDEDNSQFEDILVFLACIWLIWCILVCLFRYLRRNLSRLKNQTESKYFTVIVKTEKLFIFKTIVFSLLMILAAAVAWKASGFKLSIPAAFIPQDNMFDIGFYINRIRDAIIARNTSYGYVPSQFEANFNNIMLLSIFLNFCLLIEFMLTVSSIKLLKLVDKSPFATTLKGLALSIPIAFAAAFILALALGLRFMLPIKELLILIAFIFAYTLKDHEYS